MPLVTLTCSKELYPVSADRHRLDVAQLAVVKLAAMLPPLIATYAAELGLDPADTPEVGVQVDIKQFDKYAVNNVDLWIHVQFVELYPGKDEAIPIRDMFTTLVDKQLRISNIDCSCAVDMFWGPGHGCIMVESGAAENDLYW